VAQQISYRVGNNLYLSITDRCTLECDFCPKTKGSFDFDDYNLKMDHMPSVEEIIQSLGDVSLYDEVVFCGYGESTLRLKVLLEVSAYIKQKGGQVRVNTDGLGSLVNKHNILPEMKGLVDTISVSLNAQNEEVYNRHCQPQLEGSYQAMLDFLRQAPDYIPTVVASAINGLEGVDIQACKAIADELGVKFRKREYFETET
jgi:TatD family-associated radical SAM protein